MEQKCFRCSNNLRAAEIYCGFGYEAKHHHDVLKEDEKAKVDVLSRATGKSKGEGKGKGKGKDEDKSSGGIQEKRFDSRDNTNWFVERVKS